MVRIAPAKRSGMLDCDCVNCSAVPANPPCTVEGMPILSMAFSISVLASLSARPGAMLNEIGEAAKTPWWFTLIGVWADENFATADSGTMVSIEVETDDP